MTLRRLLFGTLALAAVWATARGGAPPAAPAQTPPAAGFAKDVVPFLAKHCYACHGNGKRKADLALDKFTDDEAVRKDRKVWDNVLLMVRSGEMPPKEKPRPPAAEADAALAA